MFPTPARRCALAAASAAAVLAACSPRDDEAAAPAAPPRPPAAMLPAPTVLDRGQLLDAIADAAEAHAFDAPAPAAPELEGRRFAVKVAFGCGWPQAEPGRTGYRLDPARQTLKVAVAPQDWSATPWAATLADGRKVEAVEGFWIRRPWLRSAGCPAVPARVGASPSIEVAGLAQVFEAGGSRLPRRGSRPYEVTRKHPSDEPPPAGGFRLAVEGRIANAGGRPIRCRADHPDQRPVCLVLVEFDRVAIEDASGETLGEWTS